MIVTTTMEVRIPHGILRFGFFTSSETFDVGVDLGSPVALDYYERAASLAHGMDAFQESTLRRNAALAAERLRTADQITEEEMVNLARGAYVRDWGNTPGHLNHYSRRSFLALLSRRFDVVAVLLESVESIGLEYGPLLRAIEWTFTILFTIEYALRLYCVGNPLRYATSFFGIVDLVMFVAMAECWFTVRRLSIRRGETVN